MVSLAGESGTNIDEVDMEAGNPDGNLTSPSEERESEVLRLKLSIVKLNGGSSFFTFFHFDAVKKECQTILRRIMIHGSKSFVLIKS